MRLFFGGANNMSSAHHAPCVLATGANAPPSPHSVIVSLSTLAAVIGYETGDRAVLGAGSAGYPRFVEGALLGAVQDALARRLVSAGCGPSTSVVLVATPAAAACMLQWARARLVCPSQRDAPFFVDEKYLESWPMPFIAWRAALYVSCAARRAQ